MSRTVLAIVLGAGLFLLFGLVPRRECTGHCAGCTRSCRQHEDQGDSHVG